MSAPERGRSAAPMKASQTTPRQFERHMGDLHRRQDGGEPLMEQDRNQLAAFRSNANFLRQKVSGAILQSEQERGRLPFGRQAIRVNHALMPVKSLMRPENNGTIFTRDIDKGELTGLTHSKRPMSVIERQLDRIGRVRKMADFNRGGGAGTYTRAISGKRVDAERQAKGNPPGYDPRRDPDLAPLGVGSIGNAGITLAFDAARVVQDMRHPLELFHNNQDSAGRIFGRELPTGRKVGRGSERLLGGMNPDYYRRTPSSPAPRAFSVERATQEAVRGHRKLQDLVEHPSGNTDHNEQVWIKAPDLRHVKTIFIQKQLDRPPRLERKTPEELEKEHLRRQRGLAAVTAKNQEVLGQYRRGDITHPEMVRERARSMSKERMLRAPVMRDKVVDQSARLPRELRLPSYWSGGKPPQGYEGLEQIRGAGGKSFSELVLHVPPDFKRAMLPQAAEANLARAMSVGSRPDHPPQLYPPPRKHKAPIV
ncbi:hypothetical protein [Janthinobacterium sp. PC23-8]|uniref:hypothetical protein n=1 Tax=Janthinobacterium sp. PC23-8 TaxID=2012679 RepID=UPI0011400761|nr:hypothetical protein [Janthinobacterium sp. PC23-8]